MISKLEIKNFESHENTVLEFDDKFSLIMGPSNSGKTSIIRALKVVSFNEFKQDSVRYGAKFCEITVHTERGTVKAKRGKNINEWDVTPKDGKTEHFESAGKGVLDCVSNIIGLKIITLGDTTIKANVMDQLEGHFMMSEVDGKGISGSLRAQIIDEISGLSGIEPLIRDIGLDNLRVTKEIKQLDETNTDLKTKLHNEQLLEKTEKALNEVSKLYNNYLNKSQTLNGAQSLNSTVDTVSSSITTIKKELDTLVSEKNMQIVSCLLDSGHELTEKLNGTEELRNNLKSLCLLMKNLKAEFVKLPDAKTVSELIDSFDTVFGKSEQIQILLNDYEALSSSFASQIEELEQLPETTNVGELITTATSAINKYKEMRVLNNSAKLLNSSIQTQNSELKNLPEIADAGCLASEVEGKSEVIEKLSETLEIWETLNNDLCQSEKKLEVLEAEFHKYEKENLDILSEFDVCPFCEQEISKEKN